MKNHDTKLRRMRPVGISFLLLCLIVFVAYVHQGHAPDPSFQSATDPESMPTTAKVSYTDKEMLIEAYINYLANAENPKAAEKNLNFLCNSPGMGTLSTGSSMIDLNEAEKNNDLFPTGADDIVTERLRVEYYAALAVQQHDLVITQFGDSAWSNVSYSLVESEPVEGTLGYRVISTGKLLDQAEYEKILYEYWEDVAAQEGITYDDIFLAEGEPVENIANKRVDIIAKYGENVPVELVTVSNTHTYEVFLSFNDKKTSLDGFGEFHFVIDNSRGEWKLLQGLSWAEP